MFRFLNTLHPELYCIRTKFGDVPQYYKDRNYAIVDVKYKDIDKQNLHKIKFIKMF